MHKASETSVIVEEKCRQVQFLSFLGMQQIVRLRYSPLVGGPTRRPTFVISVTSVLLYFFISIFNFLLQEYYLIFFFLFSCHKWTTWFFFFLSQVYYLIYLFLFLIVLSQVYYLTFYFYLLFVITRVLLDFLTITHKN